VTPNTTLSPLRLHCHPANHAGTPLTLSVTVSQTAAGLHLAYTVAGDLAALRVPVATAAGPADNLWQHTCLEAFVAGEGEAAYREFNFSPSGQWAAYRFASERVRENAQAEAELPPLTQVALRADLLTLHAVLPWAALPLHQAALSIGLSAVIEETDGRISHWALTHPGERPDFHHPAGRSLRLTLKNTP
jgi:hypothetical protein